MARFEVVDHTADIGLIAYGSTLEEVFVNAAYGMFSLIADLDQVEERIHREIETEAPDQGELLVTWLNELLYFFDAESLLFKRFEILRLDQTWLQARAFGEKVDPTRHRVKTAVKAATYHLLKLEEGNGLRAQIIFDV